MPPLSIGKHGGRNLNRQDAKAQRRKKTQENLALWALPAHTYGLRLCGEFFTQKDDQRATGRPPAYHCVYKALTEDLGDLN